MPPLLLFLEGLIIGRNFAFQNGLGLTIKTASTNSPWAYIREGLLLEGFLRPRFGGLIFGRAYFLGGLLSEFYGISKDIRIFVARPNKMAGKNRLVNKRRAPIKRLLQIN